MAKVTFVRKNSDEDIQNTDIVDGQFLVSGEGTSYVDFDDKRVSLGNNAAISQLRIALGLDTDTFTPGTAYDVGDMVIYNHMIYECNLAHVAEEFESEKWDIVPIITN